MSSVLIFDLDNTLFNTRTVPMTICQPLFTELRAANSGPDAVPQDVLENAIDDSWSLPFPQVAARHGLPDRLLHLWARLHQQITFTEPLTPFEDVIPALTALPGFKVLLTSGYPNVQHGKIDALGLRSYFDLIQIDAADEVPRKGKQKILAELLSERSWRPAELLIIGDSETSEIAAGQQLGIPTVQILRPGVIRSSLADRHILSLTELLPS